MTVTMTKTRHSSQIVRARFASDLGRPPTRASLRALQWKREFSLQRNGPFSTPSQENWNIDTLLEYPVLTRRSNKVGRLQLARSDRTYTATGKCKSFYRVLCA